MAGIEKLKNALNVLFTIGEGVEDARADDGAVDLQEVLSLVVATGVDLFDVIMNGKELWEELKDLDDSELDELKVWVENEFDLDNDVIEEKIENAVGVALALYKFLN